MRDHIIALLERYVGGSMKASGDTDISLKCPFHKGGTERNPSLSVSTVKGVYHCFTCDVAGTIPQLLTSLGLPPDTVAAETKALQPILEANRERLAHERKAQWVWQDPYRAQPPLSEFIIRHFVDWRQSLNPDPTGLSQVGYTTALLDHLEIGFDGHQTRIIFPVRDIYGNLAGVVGRALLPGGYPRYKVYEGKRTNFLGQTIKGDFYWPGFDAEYPDYKFQNHDYVWNYERVYPRLFYKKEAQTLIIVEGFKACMWLLQLGYVNTVAIMGRYLSEKQFGLLSRVLNNTKTVIFLDNNEPGRKGSINVGKRLYRAHPWVYVAQYPTGKSDGAQPDWLEAHETSACIQGAVHYPEYVAQMRAKGMTP